MAPQHFFQRLKNGFQKGDMQVQTSPAITIQTACLISIFFNILYVAPFYLSRTTRPSPSLTRDAPSVIRARLNAVTISCIISTLITVWVVSEFGHNGFKATLRLLGWWPISLEDVGKTLLLVAILFVGPLFEAGIVESGWRDWITGQSAREVISSWMGWRNFVAGPITEELIWRSLIVPLHLITCPLYPANLYQTSSSHVHANKPVNLAVPSTTSSLAREYTRHVILVTPLYFGIAHVHHFYEFRLTNPHASVLASLIRSLVQFTYTTIFGWFEAYVFVRTGSLLAVILAHSFCNWLGLPRFWGRVGQEVYISDGRAAVDRTLSESRELRSSARSPPRGRTQDVTDGEDENMGRSAEDNLLSGTHNENPIPVAHIPPMQQLQGLGIAWTVAYYVLLVAGAVGFYVFLKPLTESPHKLAEL